jgi:hypothetical protein
MISLRGKGRDEGYEEVEEIDSDDNCNRGNSTRGSESRKSKDGCGKLVLGDFSSLLR